MALSLRRAAFCSSRSSESCREAGTALSTALAGYAAIPRLVVAEGQSPKAVSLEVLLGVFPSTAQLLVRLLSPDSVQPEHSAWQLSTSATGTAGSAAGWRTLTSQQNASNKQGSQDGCTYFQITATPGKPQDLSWLRCQQSWRKKTILAIP